LGYLECMQRRRRPLLLLWHQFQRA